MNADEKIKEAERVHHAFMLIAKANSVTLLSLDEMEAIVNRALSGEFDATSFQQGDR